MALLLLLTNSIVLLAEEDKEEEKESPISIELENDEIVIKEGEEVDLSEFVNIKTQEEDMAYQVMSLSVSDITVTGTHKVRLLAVDEEHNIAETTMTIIVLSEEEYELLEEEVRYQKGKASEYNTEFLDLKGDFYDGDIYSLAQSFIGMKGDCLHVALAFLSAYFGFSVSTRNTYPVSAEEAQPGDLIYYSDGGLGVQHWAVYLGGDAALHGNYLGTTVIGKVYMNKASAPTFLRVIVE